MNGSRNNLDTIETESVAQRARSSGGRAGPRRRTALVPGAEAGAVTSSAIRVLCVDDHAVLIEGLKARFAIDGLIDVVGSLATAARLVEEIRRLRPRIVLLDIEMPGPDAFEMADRVKQAHPEVRVIILSAHIRDGYISAAFAAGVCAYFAKSDELDDIVKGIHEVARGRPDSFLLGPKVRERCRPISTGHRNGKGAEGGVGGERGHVDELSVMRAGAPMTLLASLTRREVEILRLIGKGLSRIQIAAQLCRSAKTIDAHQGRMMTKLGIAARADLMRFAIREGLAQA